MRKKIEGWNGIQKSGGTANAFRGSAWPVPECGIRAQKIRETRHADGALPISRNSGDQIKKTPVADGLFHRLKSGTEVQSFAQIGASTTLSSMSGSTTAQSAIGPSWEWREGKQHRKHSPENPNENACDPARDEAAPRHVPNGGDPCGTPLLSSQPHDSRSPPRRRGRSVTSVRESG